MHGYGFTKDEQTQVWSPPPHHHGGEHEGKISEQELTVALAEIAVVAGYGLSEEEQHAAVTGALERALRYWVKHEQLPPDMW